MRLVLLVVAGGLIASWVRGSGPEPVVNAAERARVSGLEDDVYRLGKTVEGLQRQISRRDALVEDLRRRIQDLERRSRWDAEPPSDP